ncbi:unnamed protein product [Linum trigynum]|uniref:Lysine ketoglutarate reductase trans-splicing related 1 n=1 Tax=Linum trigynum TaxID=586398 RepID=A0AAV2DFR0_9ROSI
MTSLRPWKSLKRNAIFDGGKCGFKGTQLPMMVALCTGMLFIVYRTTLFQYEHTEMEVKMHPFDSIKASAFASGLLNNLPRGIVRPNSDMELKPLWSSSSRSKTEVDASNRRYLLAMPVGITQKRNVDTVVQKFLPENFTVMLFHYDGNLDGWWDLEWSSKAIHIVAHNQTKWWFAKRFLHPAVVSIYDYIFLWDEDLGVQHFNPARYLDIVRSEGLEISQPALDPNSTEIHHRITIRARMKKFHRRVYDVRGKVKCSDSSDGPPCTGFVEGMAPVFSRSAWYCAWHLIQNDLVHGWGMDMKLGYCAQGDRTKKVGVVDREYVVHKGIQSLGGSGKKSSSNDESSKRHSGGLDPRMEIRRQSTWELQIFKDRWNKAVKEDKFWVDPFRSIRRRKPISDRRDKEKRSHHH